MLRVPKSLFVEYEILMGDIELCLLPKESPESFHPSNFLLDLWMSVNKSSVVREPTNTSSSSSVMDSAVLFDTHLLSSGKSVYGPEKASIDTRSGCTA